MKRVISLLMTLVCLFMSVSVTASAGKADAITDVKATGWPTTADGTRLSSSICWYGNKPIDDKLKLAEQKEYNDLLENGIVDPAQEYVVFGPSYDFNCHSFAWYSMDVSTNHYWIDSPYDYLSDMHSLAVLDEVKNPRIGDIAVYYVGGVPQHSAVVTTATDTDIICWSKWGRCSVYRHRLTHVPPNYFEYLSNGEPNIKFYRYPMHRYGSWSYYNSSSHIKTCGYGACTESITEAHVFSSWVSNGSSGHTHTCNTCKHSLSEAHSYSSWVNTNDSIHTRTCSKCKYAQTGSHSYTVYTQNGSNTSHNVKCSSCSRTTTQAHTVRRWVNAGVTGHTGTCTLCNQSVKQKHIFSGTACTVCGYTGPGLVEDGQHSEYAE